MSLFSTCIITTDTERRASVYRELIQRRKDHGIYPEEIEFCVYSDPEGVRAGSGGATLIALEKYLGDCTESKTKIATLQSKKILIIHSGGSNDILPTYKPEGMPFTPVPVDSSSILSPVLLDLQLNFFLKYPWRQSEIVIAPGDIFIDCDPSLLTLSRGDIHGFSVAASFEKGSHHGVFKYDSYMHSVIGYFQKAKTKFLKDNAALEGTDQCAVDTGIISLSTLFVETFLDFGNEMLNNLSIKSMVQQGILSFNLYLEVISAALHNVTYEAYKEKVGKLSGNTEAFLERVFKKFNQFDLTATLVKNASFHHPDTIKKYLEMCIDLQYRPVDLWYSQSYAELGVKRNESWIVYNTHSTNTPLRKGKPVLIESVQNSTFENPLGNNIFTGVHKWETDSTIPEGICIDSRSIDSRNVYCVYGISDFFSKADSIDSIIFCGLPLKIWLEQRSLKLSDIGFSQAPYNLSEASLFGTNASLDFLSGYWHQPIGTQWADEFRKHCHFSLNQCSSVDLALLRDEKRKEIRAEILRKQITNGHGWISISSKDFRGAFLKDPSAAILEKICNETGDILTKAYRRRLIDTVYPSRVSSESVGFLQDELKTDLLESGFAFDSDQCVIVKCPVRVDIAGGWTDMPPFTLRYGGSVVNFAANLHGTEPVQVFCKRSKENSIRIVSIDKGVNCCINEFSELQTVPSGCELVSAVLRRVGFTCNNHASLKSLLSKLGGGIEITTFCGVPQGSGLGTSAILMASILSAIYKIFGKELSQATMFNSIISIEQIPGMGTGWQDLLGGVRGGIKLLKSKPGLIPETSVEILNSEILSFEMAQHFTLVDTGVPRISKNSGYDVASIMNENVPSYFFTLNYLKTCAIDAARAISTHDFELLSNVINECRYANKRIHSSLSNVKLDLLFDVLKPHYMAVKMLGAGGGGCALFLSKSPEDALDLRKAILSMAAEAPKVIDFSLNTSGMNIRVL